MVKISCNFLYLFIANGGTKQAPLGNEYSLAAGFFFFFFAAVGFMWFVG